jgi:hypothetical protein
LRDIEIIDKLMTIKIHPISLSVLISVSYTSRWNLVS